MRHQHDSVARSDAEHGDEADQRADREHTAAPPHAGDSTDQRERQIDHHQRGVARAAESGVEQDADSGGDQRAEQQEPLSRATGALELAAILDAIVRLGFEHSVHRSLDFARYGAEIASGDVAGNDDAPLAVLVSDLVRRGTALQLRDFTERDQCRAGCEREALEFAELRRRLAVAEHDVVARLVAQDLGRQVSLVDRLHGGRELGRCDPRGGQRGGVRLDA